MGKSIPQLIFLPSACTWRDSLILKSTSLLSNVVTCGWAALQCVSAAPPLCSNHTYGVTGGRTEDGLVGWGENVKALFSDVPSQLSWAVTSPFTFYYSVWCVNRHLSPLPLWFICVLQSGRPSLAAPFLPVHAELATTLESWWVQGGNVCWCVCVCVRGLTDKYTQRPRWGAAVWPYCWPIKSPQILTDVKVQGCRLFADWR